VCSKNQLGSQADSCIWLITQDDLWHLVTMESTSAKLHIFKDTEPQKTLEDQECYVPSSYQFTNFLSHIKGRIQIEDVEDNVKMDFKNVGLDGVDWIHMA
jgi:hypothetical protein